MRICKGIKARDVWFTNNMQKKEFSTANHAYEVEKDKW